MAQDLSERVTRYLSYAQSVPRLTREEEHELAVRVRNAGEAGDPVALDQLARANLRYVVAIAMKYRRYRVPIAELVAEGNVGLVVAARKFDADRGTRFVTYAAHWIRAYMLEHILKGSSMVGTGSGPIRSKLFFGLRRERAKLASQGLAPDVMAEQLAATFGVTVDKLRILEERLDARDVSLDAPTHDDGSATFADGLATGGPSQEDELSRMQEAEVLSARVREAVGELDPRERFIVETRLMADGANELSLAEIGRHLGVSRERARQIEARAKQKMKKHLLAAEPDMKAA